MKRQAALAVCFLLTFMAGCDSPDKTLVEIRENLTAFQRQPNIITLDKLSKSFKKMDEHLESLKARERTDEADLYFRQAKLMREEYLQTRNNFLKWSQRQSQQSPQPAESQ